MLTLAAGKRRTGRALGNSVLETEGRVTLIDAYLAAAILLGLALNSALNWWWADPLAGLLIVLRTPRRPRSASHKSLNGTAGPKALGRAQQSGGSTSQPVISGAADPSVRWLSISHRPESLCNKSLPPAA
jgi:hypothetical protein